MEVQIWCGSEERMDGHGLRIVIRVLPWASREVQYMGTRYLQDWDVQRTGKLPVLRMA